jgi:hypothetical protein
VPIFDVISVEKDFRVKRDVTEVLPTVVPPRIITLELKCCCVQRRVFVRALNSCIGRMMFRLKGVAVELPFLKIVKTL